MNNLVIELSGEKVVLVKPAIEFKSTKISIYKLEDFPQERKVIALIVENSHFVTLWEGEEYDTIGDWTNQNVIDRVKELYDN